MKADPMQPLADVVESQKTEHAQALTVPQQVDKALDYAATAAKLKTLAAASTDIKAITNRAGYDQVHALRMVLKNTRINVERGGELARKDAVEFQRLVIARANELIAIIKPEEQRLEALQKAEDDLEKAEKDRKAKIEADRIAAIEAVIRTIAEAPGESIHADADKLRSRIGIVQAVDLSALDEVYRPRAIATRMQAVSDLERMLAARIKADEDAAALAEARAEAERMRAEQAERDQIAAEALQAERDRAAAESLRIALQAKADAKAYMDRIVELQAAEAARVAAAQAEADAARTAQEALERAESERLATLAAEAEAERVAAAAAENARLEAERTEAYLAERAEKERRNADLIANCTLIDAGLAAMVCMINAGLGDTIQVRMLEAAILREQARAYPLELAAEAARRASPDVAKQEPTPKKRAQRKAVQS